MSERLTIVEIKRDGKLVRIRYPELTDQEKSAKDFKLVQVGHDPQQPGWWMPIWVYWFGGRLWDGERRITANDPGNIQAFEWFRRQSEKYGVDNRRGFGASFGNFNSPQNPFSDGAGSDDVPRGVDVQFHRQVRAANGMGRGTVSRRRTRRSIRW